MDRHSLRELLDQHTLPPNHALSSLPPPPQTPHHSRHAHTGYDSDELEPKYEPRSQRRRGPEREHPMSSVKGRSGDTRLDDTGSATLGRLPRSTTLPSLSREPQVMRDRPHFEPSYPTLSTRQSSLNTARNISPSKLDFLSPTIPSTALLHPSSAAKPPADGPFKARRDVSASFMLPQGADISMLQDVTFGELGRLSLGNDTMEMDLRVAGKRPEAQEADKAESRGGSGRYGDIGSVRGRPSSVKHQPASPKRSSRPPIHTQDQSALLPTTPSRELLTSTNLIMREEPPWAGSDSLATVIPSRSPRPPLDTTTRRPGSVRRPRLPPSTSSNLLAPPAHDHAGDVSALLPVSPLKTRHLMSDEYLLTQTKMEDESMMSMSLIMPPVSPTKRRSQPPSSVASGQASPAKTPRGARNRMQAEAADMTMDIQQMMAKVKPKGSSGAEESVLDLCRADLEDDDVNTSLMSVNFIPPDLRPGLVRSRSLSRLELEKRSANAAAPLAFASPTRTLPRTRPTSYIAGNAPTQPSPTRTRRAAPSAMATKRVSLSVGALPLPSSASMRKLELPTRRLASPAKPTQAPATSSTRSTALPARTTTSVVPRATAKSSMPPPPAPSSRMPQPAKPRLGSTASVASTTRTSTLPRATSVRSLSKPATIEAPAPRTASSRPVARPAALPQSTAGPSARATAPRTFGGDAAGVSNRLPRPTPVPAAKTITAKGSMGPPSGVPRSSAVPTAAKSRTLSTPASTYPRPTPSTRPPTTTARAPTSRSSALPTSRSAIASINTTARVVAPSSAAPARPQAAPAPSSVAHQTGTIGRSSSKSSAAAGLADIRARLDRLQARHQISRPTRS